ncbi:MAG: PHB depolymerase family esterase [Salinibacter sp.]|uniref:alpha/beta hydrolase family esterase n=1 Tax=Salinibacter sp. TaxID=2065818 RepID=UPI002FC2FC41
MPFSIGPHTWTRVLAPLLLVSVLSLGCDSTSSRSGPPPFDDSPGWHRGAIEHNNQSRAFKYYVPGDLPGDAPVVMALHGATIGMDGMFARSRTGSREWLEIADEEGVLILVPNASHDVQPVWNDCTPLPTRGTPDDAGFLTALTDWTTSRADVDADSVFVYGVSNGGQMANRLAIEHPDRYAGFAAFISNVTASLGDDEECPMPSAPIPALIVSGKTDATTPFEGGFAPDWGDTLRSAPATRDVWVDNNIQGDPPPRQTNQNTEDNSAVSCEITPAPQTGADVQLCAFDGGHTVPAGLFESTRLTWRFFRGR